MVSLYKSISLQKNIYENATRKENNFVNKDNFLTIWFYMGIVYNIAFNINQISVN